MKKYESQRGAILVESALVVGAIFLMLFGTVFLAIIGFDQMSSDGAAYEVAHQTAIGASAPPAQSAHNTFPDVPQANISAEVQPAPSASLLVDYNYNDPNSNTAYNSVNNRHGGVSMMQGTSVNGVANKNSASILGMPINVIGNMVEPMWLENGLHFDAQNSDSYGGTAAVCATPPPAQGNATPQPARCFQGNVFTQGENAPPYYTSIDVIPHCSRDLPWGTNIALINPPNPDICQSSAEKFTPIGVAEFLDITNWCPASGDAAACPNAIATPGLTGSTQTDSTFANIACHQRVYQKIATFFQNNQSLDAVYVADGGDNVLPYAQSYGSSAGPAFYYYGLSQSPINNASNTFLNWAGFGATLGTQNDYTTETPSSVDLAVREVYGWDGQDLQTPAVADPLKPNVGC